MMFHIIHPSDQNRNRTVRYISILAETIGGSILLFLGVIVLGAALLFFLGHPISANLVYFAAAITAIYGLTWICAREKSRLKFVFFGIYGLSIAGIFIFSLWTANRFFDLSFDGQCYHASAITQLASGWNPIQQPWPESSGCSYPVNFYPKGSWMISTTIYLLTDHFEQAKAINFWLLAAGGLLSLSALLRRPSISSIAAISLSVLLCLNPVMIDQLLSLYNDGQLGALFLCLVALILLLVNDFDQYLLPAFGSVLILIANLKFTGAVYGVILASGVWLWFVLTKHPKIMQLTFAIAISILLSFFFVGYNPYVTNTIDRRWEQALATTSVEINTPENLREQNYLNRLIWSMFGESSSTTQPARLQAPFQFWKDELQFYAFTDVRIGGFGPFFGEAIILTLLLAVLIFVGSRKRKITPDGKMIIYLTGLIMLTILINPEAWWARYVPQAWIVPVFVILFGITQGSKGNLIKALSILLFLLLFANSLLVAYPYLNYQRSHNRELSKTLQDLSAQQVVYQVDFGYGIANKARFDEYGIQYSQVKQPTCEKPILIGGMGTIVCPPIE
jgi:hypothetical protein